MKQFKLGSLATLCVVLGLIFGAGSASAVTVGQSSFTPDPDSCNNAGVTAVQTGVGFGDSYTIPFNGTITSFQSRSHAHSGGTAQAIFGVFRPTATVGTFTVIGQTSLVNLPVADPGTPITYTPAAPIAVQTGDLLGFFVKGTGGFPSCADYPSNFAGDTYFAALTPLPANGNNVALGAQNTNLAINASATLVTQCSDGIDNDGNGETDFPADLGCSSDIDNSEASVVGTCASNVSGTNGPDTLIGSDGKDTFSGRNGDDFLSGQGGSDCLFGDGGSDTVNGDAGNDQLHGGAGADLLDGSDGTDELYGEAGGDTINGGDGADQISGGSGVDALFGDAGADRILARDGEKDTVDCGPGADSAQVDAIDIVSNCETLLP
jgi:Ca2+-binding RTX toxin-like protein